MHVADGCTLRHRHRQHPYVRRRWLHFAGAPPAASIRASQTAALRGSTADNVHAHVADGCTLRRRRRRCLYARRRRLHFAAVPPTTSIRASQTAAHCGGAAGGVHTYVADGCTSRRYRRQRPYGRRRWLHIAAAPPEATTDGRLSTPPPTQQPHYRYRCPSARTAARTARPDAKWSRTPVFAIAR